MKPERWRRLQDLFEIASGLPATERGSYLEKECAGENVLRRQVESLILSGEEAGSFIGAAIEEAAALPVKTARIPVLQQVGPYRIVRLRGHGAEIGAS